MIGLLKNPYVILGFVVFMSAVYAIGYVKGQYAKETEYLKKDIGKGVENNEILANRVDDAGLIELLKQGKF